MRTKTLMILIALIVLAYFPITSYGQGLQTKGDKTITLETGGTVCDLSGEWKALYEHYGSLAWIGNSESMIMMEHKGTTFVGKTTVDGTWYKKGAEKMKGEIDKDGIKNAQYHIPNMGWTDAKGDISEDCNKMILDTGIGVKAILERK
jgi:hypothetical protein